MCLLRTAKRHLCVDIPQGHDLAEESAKGAWSEAWRNRFGVMLVTPRKSLWKCA